MKKSYVLFFLVSFVYSCMLSQEASNEKLKIFIEGKVLDFNYMRNNIPFVSFVNDPQASEVHVIITRQITGGGGFLFTLEYNSMEFPNVPKLRLTCKTFSFDTNMIIKEKLVKTLQSGLLPFINEKNGMQEIDIVSLRDSSDKQVEITEVTTNDPWDSWVLRLGADIGFEGEEKERDFEYRFSTRITKITNSWKIVNDYDFEKSKEVIEKDNGEIIKSIKVDQDLDSKLIFSIDQHWSYGIFLNGSQSTYRNTKIDLKTTPAIQYNFYTWGESDRKEFTFSYFVGPAYNQYYETTIFNKKSEVLWEQTLEIGFKKIETWGEIDLSMEGGHYFPGFKNYYLQTRLDFGIRILKGLSIYFRTQAESVHNQMYLPGSELTDEDLLLNTIKRPSTFEYSGRIGFRFQFGSVYNNVVNERL